MDINKTTPRKVKILKFNKITLEIIEINNIQTENVMSAILEGFQKAKKEQFN